MRERNKVCPYITDVSMLSRRRKTGPKVIHIDIPHAWEYVRALAFCFDGYGGAVVRCGHPRFLAPKTFREAAWPPQSFLLPLETFGGAEWLLLRVWY